ncbi:MAG: hypothetical protein Q7I99_09340 [Acholeplasmataceae bacterium]|nr:hypothetical protein [Acholeplasmataceae bacterium]
MNTKADKMRYQTNKTGYSLILLGLAISIVALFSIITPPAIIPNFGIAVEILINIVLLLVTFLAAERCKTYSRGWALTSFVIAAIHVLRIFYMPTILVAKGQLTGFQFMMIVIYLLSAATCIVFGALITLRKHAILMKHLRELGE